MLSALRRQRKEEVRFPLASVVYNKLGYGFTESIYAAALQYELVKAGRKVDREVKAIVGRGEL